MKATVQYNDFIGTAAADMSDLLLLDTFLKNRKIDTAKYEGVGLTFYAGNSGLKNHFSGSVLARDKSKSTATKPYLVQISFDNTPLGIEEFFDLFKRFHVVISKKHLNLDSYEIDEEISIDDEGNEVED